MPPVHLITACWSIFSDLNRLQARSWPSMPCGRSNILPKRESFRRPDARPCNNRLGGRDTNCSSQPTVVRCRRSVVTLPTRSVCFLPLVLDPLLPFLLASRPCHTSDLPRSGLDRVFRWGPLY